MAQQVVAAALTALFVSAQVPTASLSGLAQCKYSNGQACLNSPQNYTGSLNLGTFKRGAGMCSMMGVTPVEVKFGATQPAYYLPISGQEAHKQKYKNKFSEWDAANQAAFQLDCPLFYKAQIVEGKNDYLCCTEDQYKVMQTQYRMIGGLCDVSKQVLQNVWCNYACHPSQTLFMDVNQVHFYPSTTNASVSYPAIEEATYYVGDDWARDVYEYSKGDLIAKVLCQPQAGCNSGLGLLKKMGEYQFNGVGSPNQVNFVAASSMPTADKCSCNQANLSSGCILPLDGTLPSCAGVCGSVCAASPTPLSYTPGCNNAQTSGSNTTNATSPDAWKDLFTYMEAGVNQVDFQTVNIASLIACICLFLVLVCLIVLAARHQPAEDAKHVFTSYVETRVTSAMETWGRVVSLNPYRVLSIMSVVAVVCCIGLYRAVIEVDPIKLWVAESSTAYKERDRFGQLFMPFYRTSQMILRPKDGGSIARGFVLQEALALQEKVAKLRAKVDGTEVSLSDICWKATGTACTVNSITQYFQNNLTHYQVYEQYNLSLAHFQNCLYSPSYADVQTCQKLAALQANLPPSMGDCPCLSSYGAPMDMYTTVLGQFPPGARSNVELFKESKAMLSTILAYNYYDDAKNDKAKAWEREMIEFLKLEAKRNTVFNIDFMAEVSIADEIAVASRGDVTPAALSYVLMIIYVTLGINRWHWRDLKQSFAQAKLLLGFLGIALILLSVLTTIGFFSWCGAHIQIVIMEVVPFLTLAIGVDNIFLLVNQVSAMQNELKHGNTPLSVETIVSKALGKIGPSILLASCTESLAFVFGCISPMPAVLWFAAFSAAAVLVNFVFQMTMFVALIVLDKRRELARLQQPTADLQEPMHIEPKVELLSFAERCVEWYASFLSKWPVKIGVVFVFLTATYLSIRSAQHLDQGLNNKDAMPSDSYMISYFDTIDAALETGPPIFYIVEAGYMGNPAFDFSDTTTTQKFCKSKSFCAPQSIPKIVEALGNAGRSNLTRMAPGVYYSWLDDFWPFASAQSECCRVDSTTKTYLPLDSSNATYMATRKTSQSCLPVEVATPPIPKDNFMSLFRIFASANAGPLCAHGGGSIYRGQFSVDEQPIPVTPTGLTLNNDKAGKAVTAVSYMAISNANPTQGDYIQTYKQARRAAQYMSETTGIQVWVYSIFFCFFDQYLTIVNDTYLLVGLALLVIFLMHVLYFGAFVLPLIVTLVIANVCLCVVGLMEPFGILLNGLSVVNLIICAGVSVEFCSHMARSFHFATKNTFSGASRMKDALHHVMLSVIFGITITKIVGLSALTLCDSRVFQKYYFRMYLTIVLCGLLHGMVLLPVLLSLVEDVRLRWTRRRT